MLHWDCNWISMHLSIAAILASRLSSNGRMAPRSSLFNPSPEKLERTFCLGFDELIDCLDRSRSDRQYDNSSHLKSPNTTPSHNLISCSRRNLPQPNRPTQSLNLGLSAGLVPNTFSISSITLGVNLGSTSRAPKFSVTCSLLLAPVITVETRGFLAHQARASWDMETPRFEAMGRRASTVWRRRRPSSVSKERCKGETVSKAQNSSFRGTHFGDVLHRGIAHRQPGPLWRRRTGLVFPRKHTRRQRRPNRRPEPIRLLVKRRIFLLHPLADKHVVLRLFHRWPDHVEIFGNFVSFHQFLRGPFRGSPVHDLSGVDEVVERPNRLFDGRHGIGTVGKEEVKVGESHAFEGGVAAFDEVLAGEAGCVGAAAGSEKDFGGDDDVFAFPAELHERCQVESKISSKPREITKKELEKFIGTNK